MIRLYSLNSKLYDVLASAKLYDVLASASLDS